MAQPKENIKNGIATYMQPSNTKFNGTTYGFKHMFEPMFGYITNEEMKEILLELGIRIVNMQNLNGEFKITFNIKKMLADGYRRPMYVNYYNGYLEKNNG